ncbi:MAG TPA: mechanosensitive ion channel domain-containing protein [Verrucomicrobiae bacterium]|nr:mechanosensitive ion channel domain-containing protein [Verrucomicrobiae bacterium]
MNIDFISWIDKRWFVALAVIVIAWIAQHFGGLLLKKLIGKTVRSTTLNKLTPEDVRKRQNTLISVLTVTWRIVVYTIAGFSLFRLAFPSIDLTPLLASAGVLSIVIGFGAQSIVKDFLAGIFIIAENQYRVGDVVDIDGAAGVVERITLRCTVVRDIDGNVHYLSNGNIMHPINKTMDYSKAYFTVAVHPDSDVDEVVRVINEVGASLAQEGKWKDKIIEPPQFMNLGAFNDIALEVNVVGTTKPGTQWSVSSEMKKRLIAEFARQGIELSQYSTFSVPKR